MFHPFPISPYTVRGDKKGTTNKTRSSPRRLPLAEWPSSATNQRSFLSDTSSIRLVTDDEDRTFTKDTSTLQTTQAPAPLTVVSTNQSTLQPSLPKPRISDEKKPVTTRPSSSAIDALLPLPVYAPRRISAQVDSIDNSLSSEGDTFANYASSVSPTIPSASSQSATSLSTPALQQGESAFIKPLGPKIGPSSQSTIRLVIPSISENVPLAGFGRRHSVSSVSSSVSNQSIVISPPHGSNLPSRTSTVHQAKSKHVSTPVLPQDRGSSHFSPGSSPLTMHPINFDDIAPLQSPKTPKRQSDQAARELSPSGYPRASYAEPKRPSAYPKPRPITLHDPSPRNQMINRSSVLLNRRDLPFFEEKPQRPRTPDDVLVHDESCMRSQRSSQALSMSSEAEEEAAHYDIAKIEEFKTPKLRRVRGSIISPLGSELKFPLFPRIKVPQPVFGKAGVSTLPARRESEEGEDTLGDLPDAPRLQPKRSGYLTKLKVLSRNGSSDSLNSQLSFSGELDWVKRFYSGSSYSVIESPYCSPYASRSRLNTATSLASSTSPLSEAFPAEIYRPRNRPRLIHNLRQRASGESIATAATEASWSSRIIPQQWVSSVWGSSVIFSPRLRPDRHAPPQVSALRPPSLEDPTKAPLGPVGRQVILFSLGFICPVTWFIAAFLSIPAKPETLDEKGPRESGVPSRQDPRFSKPRKGELSPEQLEKQFVKAHWWRSLNRIMCVAGLAIIGALVALIILALRLHS